MIRGVRWTNGLIVVYAASTEDRESWISCDICTQVNQTKIIKEKQARSERARECTARCSQERLRAGWRQSLDLC